MNRYLKVSKALFRPSGRLERKRRTLGGRRPCPPGYVGYRALNGTGAFPLNTSDIPSGVYFLQVRGTASPKR